MPNAQIRVSEALSPLNCVKRERRLASLVSLLARELERLDEDNTQLRAAVSVYRDVVRALSPPPGEIKDGSAKLSRGRPALRQ